MFYNLTIALMMFIPFYELYSSISKKEIKWHIWLLLLVPLASLFLFQSRIIDINIKIGEFIWNINIPFVLTFTAAICMTYFIICYKKKLSFQTPIVIVCFFVIDLIVKIIYAALSNFDFNYYNYFYNNKNEKYFFILTYLMISIIVSFSFASSRKNGQNESPLKLFILFITLIGSFSLALIQNLLNRLVENNSFEEFYFLFFLVLILFAVTLVLFVYYELENNRKRVNSKYLQLKSNLDNYYDKQMALNQDELIKLKHDMNNFLEVIKIKDEKIYDELKEKIKSAVMFNFCSDETLNKILVLKAAEANNEGIKFNVDVIDKEKLNILDIDKISLFTNILDNAIDGAKRSNDKIINIDIHYADMFLNIHVNNTCDKIEHKIDTVYHGKGTEIIRDIIDKYHGEINTIYANGIYSLTIDMDLAKTQKIRRP